MSLRQSALVKSFFVLVLLPLPSCGETKEEPPAGQIVEFPSCHDSIAGPSFLEERITANFDGAPLTEIVKHLNGHVGLAVSFIEGPSPTKVDIHVEGESVRSFIGALLRQATGYKCAVIEDHVLIYHDEPALHQWVEEVDITQELRGQAARAYVKHASRQVKGMESLGVLLGGPLESEVFSETVTLARDAALIDHLCQLLGKNPNVIFWIRYASTGSRYINFGLVARR